VRGVSGLAVPALLCGFLTLAPAAAGQGPDYAFGRATAGDSPICVVDGYIHIHIADCITYLNNLHSASNGVIFSTIPETINGTEFALNNFHGTLMLGAVPTSANNCAASPSPCWQTKGPIMLPSYFRIVGMQSPSITSPGSSNGGFGAGTVFSIECATSGCSTSHFPAPLGPTVSPASLSCSTVSGSVPAGTYRVQTAYFANALTSSNNSNPFATPLWAAAGPDAATPTACDGSHRISFNAPAARANPNTNASPAYDAVGFVVYVTQVGGGAHTELKVPAADLTCPGTASSVDVDGCATFTGQVTINAIPAAGSTLPPYYQDSNLSIDGSNPLFVLGCMTNSIGGTGANTFGVRLEHLTIDGTPDGNTNTPVLSTPAIIFTNLNGQENSGLDDVTFTGGLGTYNGQSAVGFYGGFLSGNSFVRQLNMPSNCGPNTGTFDGIILDGRGSGNGGPREISDSTIACQGTGTVSTPQQILATGAKVAVSIISTHIENAPAGGIASDNILCDNGANVFVLNTTGATGTTLNGKAQNHATSATTSLNGGTGCGTFEVYSGKIQSGRSSVKDDATTVTINPSGTGGTLYFGSEYVGQMSAQNLLMTAMAPTLTGSGFGSSPGITSNGSASFTITVGTTPSAAAGTITFGSTAANGWGVWCQDITHFSSSIFITQQTASTTTTASIQNFASNAAANAWMAGDTLSCTAWAR